MTIYQYPFLDFSQLNESLNRNNITSDNKLEAIYEKMDGQFLAPHIMNGSRVGICSIGGFPVHLNSEGQLLIGKSQYTVEELKVLLYETVGMSAFMSYLNPKNKSLMEIANSTLDMKHYSVLHTINLSVLICGITSGVEHELSSQRDIMHLSRVTVAKTKAQAKPCLVLRNIEHLGVYNEVLQATQKVLSTSGLDDMEVRNLLFPSAKASAIMLTGSLRNFMKLVALKDTGGKEDELIDILNKLEHALSCVFNELFEQKDNE